MNLSELKQAGFLGSLAERMTRTLPGQLAHQIDQILYHSFTYTVEVAPGVNKSKICFPDAIYSGDIGKSETVNTLKALREAFHYLEACALREVTK